MTREDFSAYFALTAISEGQGHWDWRRKLVGSSGVPPVLYDLATGDAEHVDRLDLYRLPVGTIPWNSPRWVPRMVTRVNLGYARLLQRDLEQATKLSEEAIALYRKQGYRHARIAVPVDNLGWAALLRGDEEDAKRLFQESLMLCRDLGDKLGAAESLEGLACVAEKGGETERSARLFGAADFLFGELNIPRDRALREPYLSEVQSRSDRAWEEGSKLTFEEAVEYALAGNRSSSSALRMPGQPSTKT